MMTVRNVSMMTVAFVLAAGVLAAPGVGHAGIDPRNKCVSAKMKAAGKHCKKVLKAWSVWDKKQDDDKRDEKIAKAETKLGEGWAKAEEKATDKGVDDCDETTATAAEIALMVGTAAAEIVAEINNGLVLGNTDDGKCGSKFLNVAAKKCQAFLKAESKHVKKPDKDPDRAKLAENKAKASLKFDEKWIKVESLGCAAGTSAAVIEQLIDDFSDDVVLATTVSPNVDDTQFTTISPTGTIEYEGVGYTPVCMEGSDYHYFVKRGSVNKLLMYYQGGGACWEQLTCIIPVCKDTVDPVGENPSNWGSASGFADFTDPDNPFKDWNIVIVSYCSCDIHFGDAAQDYPLHVEHRGFHNAKVVEKWAREHFVNPEVVFVTGSSAGAYGAVFHAPLLHEVWQASQFHVLGDAGNGVITPDFLQNEFNNWNFQANLPDYIPGVVEAIDSGAGMPAYVEAVADYFPDTNWAHYTSAFDGGSGGQTGFYNVMLEGSPLGALTWWEGSCAFNAQMRTQAFDTAAAVSAQNDNYRYYIGTGSRHTMWGSGKVYTDTTGGVPTIVDWINEMLTSGAGWTNEEASPFNVLLSGDPQPPAIPTAPFEQSGSDIIVNCP